MGTILFRALWGVLTPVPESIQTAQSPGWVLLAKAQAPSKSASKIQSHCPLGSLGRAGI